MILLIHVCLPTISKLWLNWYSRNWINTLVFACGVIFDSEGLSFSWVISISIERWFREACSLVLIGWHRYGLLVHYFCFFIYHVDFMSDGVISVFNFVFNETRGKGQAIKLVPLFFLKLSNLTLTRVEQFLMPFPLLYRCHQRINFTLNSSHFAHSCLTVVGINRLKLFRWLFQFFILVTSISVFIEIVII